VKVRCGVGSRAGNLTVKVRCGVGSRAGNWLGVSILIIGAMVAADSWSWHVSYLCSISQSDFELRPRGGDKGSTRALHLRQAFYLSN